MFPDGSRIRGCKNFVGNPGDHFSSMTLREDVESGAVAGMLSEVK